MKPEFHESNDFVAEGSVRVLNLLENLRTLAKASFGLSLTTHTDESLRGFLSLDLAVRHDIESKLAASLQIFQEAAQEGTLDTSSEIQIRCVNKAIWKYGFFAKGDWEHLVEATDVIEIYDFNNTQIYRNLEFLRVCSYDLLKVMTSEWWMLWDRSEKALDDLRRCVGLVYDANGPIELNIPQFLTREKSAERRAFLTRFKWFIPLWKPGQSRPEAFVSLAAGPEVELPGSLDLHFMGRSA